MVTEKGNEFVTEREFAFQRCNWENSEKDWQGQSFDALLYTCLHSDTHKPIMKPLLKGSVTYNNGNTISAVYQLCFNVF